MDSSFENLTEFLNKRNCS